MLTLHDIIRLREMDAVAAVHPLQPGQALVDLKDHRAGGLEDGTPGVVGDAQAAVALVIRQRDGDKCRVAADVPVPVEAGQGAQDHGQELDQATGLQLPLVIPQVPAVIVEGDLLRVALHHLDPGADDQSAADLHVCQPAFPGGQRPVHQLRISAAEAVVYPVTGADRPLRGHLRCHKFAPVKLHIDLVLRFCLCVVRPDRDPPVICYVPYSTQKCGLCK